MGSNTVSIIAGGIHSDARGTIFFINDFDMSAVKRMYMIEHPDASIVRAWQGHKLEQKWFVVTAGSFKVALIAPDNWNEPSKDLPVQEFTLSASEPSVLHIPGGYLNGFKALEPNSKITVFSDATVEESKADDYRFEKDKWFSW